MHFCQNFNADASRWLRAALIAGVAALPLMLAPVPGAAQTATSDGDGRDVTAQVQRLLPVALPSLAPLVEQVSPAVVNISAHINGNPLGSTERSRDDSDPSGSPLEEFMRRFFDQRGLPPIQRETMALGSGFLIDAEGHIVTNNHVVGNADRITVILQDNSRHPATIVGRDDKTDLALIKIETQRPLPYVSWGDSDQTKVGDWVVAVGNAFGLGGTVTAGIVSAVGRNISEGPYDDFIQIDAPINRGNSGGPAFNLGAEVIGVNTAIYSPSGGSVGIGFAVPSNVARNVVTQLKDTGRVTRGWLGVSIQGITPSIAQSLGLDPDRTNGALVAAVSPNSPAARSDLRQGDIIVSAAGRPINAVNELPRVVAATQPGEQLELTILRDGQERTVAVTVDEMPETPPRPLAAAPFGQDEATATSLGLQLSTITPVLRRQHNIPQDVEGVVVTRVDSDSPAAAVGLEPGDVIVSVDRRATRTPRQAAEELRQAADKGSVLLLVNRRGTSQFVGMTVTPGVGSGRP